MGFKYSEFKKSVAVELHNYGISSKEISKGLDINIHSLNFFFVSARKEGIDVSKKSPNERLNDGLEHYFTHLLPREHELDKKDEFIYKKIRGRLIDLIKQIEKSTHLEEIIRRATPEEKLIYAVLGGPYPSSSELLHSYYVKETPEGRTGFTKHEFRSYIIYELIHNIQRNIINPDLINEKLVREVLSTLNPKEEKVLIKLYYDNLTLEEIGNEMGITGSRIEQIEAKALGRLRHPKRYNKLIRCLVHPEMLKYIQVLEQRKSYLEDRLKGTEERLAETEGVLKSIPYGKLKQFYDQTEKPQIIDNILAEKLAKSVHEFELSVRSSNCLKNANITTIKELAQKTESEMLKTKNFGRKSLIGLRIILEGMDLSFGMKFD